MTDGKCTVCKGKCGWEAHSNLDHEFVHTTKKKQVTKTQLEAKYVDATNKKSNSQQIKDGVMKDLWELRK